MYAGKCDDCGAIGPLANSPEEAADAWNARASVPVEALRKVLAQADEVSWIHSPVTGAQMLDALERLIDQHTGDKGQSNDL